MSLTLDLVLQLPALRTLGNIVTGNDAQTQCVLDGGILPYLRTLMNHTRSGIVRVSLPTISYRCVCVWIDSIVSPLGSSMDCVKYCSRKQISSPGICKKIVHVYTLTKLTSMLA